jgi:hypothetical protein
MVGSILTMISGICMLLVGLLSGAVVVLAWADGDTRWRDVCGWPILFTGFGVIMIVSALR